MALNESPSIRAARMQGTFRLENPKLWQQALDGGMRNRSLQMAEKFALALAIDLGRDRVDEDCQRRGLALAEYLDAAYAYIQTPEAETRQGRLEIAILRTLERGGGKLTSRELAQRGSARRYGTADWNRALSGLAANGDVAVESEKMASGQTKIWVRLLNKV